MKEHVPGNCELVCHFTIAKMYFVVPAAFLGRGGSNLATSSLSH